MLLAVDCWFWDGVMFAVLFPMVTSLSWAFLCHVYPPALVYFVGARCMRWRLLTSLAVSVLHPTVFFYAIADYLLHGYVVSFYALQSRYYTSCFVYYAVLRVFGFSVYMDEFLGVLGHMALHSLP